MCTVLKKLLLHILGRALYHQREANYSPQAVGKPRAESSASACTAQQRKGVGGGVYYQAVFGEARTTCFRVSAARTSLRRRERTPAAQICPTVPSPLPLNPLEIYCHPLTRRLPHPRFGGKTGDEERCDSSSRNSLSDSAPGINHATLSRHRIDTKKKTGPH